VQNATWGNASRALDNLRDRGLLDLAQLADLTDDVLAQLIRPAGCQNIKARRLRSLAVWTGRQGGPGGLRRCATGHLRAGLRGVWGIGPETADAILLYAFDRPVFVVDGYARRVFHRYGLLTGREDYNTIQQRFHSSLVPDPTLYAEYHALVVRLAKTHCRVKAQCAGCPLARLT